MKKFILVPLVLIALVLTTSCTKDDDPYARVTISEGASGDLDGDFIGDGGSTVQAYTWVNNLTTADYNADITATTDGIFSFVVADANGTVVLDRQLSGAVEPDSFSGVTAAGVEGNWTVTITLTSFNGSGSFSLSEGN